MRLCIFSSVNARGADSKSYKRATFPARRDCSGRRTQAPSRSPTRAKTLSAALDPFGPVGQLPFGILKGEPAGLLMGTYLSTDTSILLALVTCTRRRC